VNVLVVEGHATIRVETPDGQLAVMRIVDLAREGAASVLGEPRNVEHTTRYALGIHRNRFTSKTRGGVHEVSRRLVFVIAHGV